MGEIVSLAGYKFHFIREYENLVQDPSNIYLSQHTIDNFLRILNTIKASFVRPEEPKTQIYKTLSMLYFYYDFWGKIVCNTILYTKKGCIPADT